MSPRPKRMRRMNSLPSFRGFMPVGKTGSLGNAIVLNYDEYEAIKLCDYDGLIQLEASKLMNISRPTFTRVYESARKKVAQAIIEVRPLQISGGQVTLHGNWFKCFNCTATFTNPHSNNNLKCPLCSDDEIISINKISDLEFTKQNFRRRMGRGHNE